MPTSPDEIIDAAILLPESDRMRVVTRLLETLPDEAPGISIDDPNFLAELQARANDLDGAVPLEKLWDHD